MMTADEAISRAEQLLPGTPAADGEEDPRWQAIQEVGDFIPSHPLPVWRFAQKWGCHSSDDVRMAIATCLVEHLLEHHFDLLFPEVEAEALRSKYFADMFRRCSKFGQAQACRNAKRFDQLRKRVGA
jgi:hypothetical protein